MKIHLTLDINVVNGVLGLLGKCPYEQVAGTIDTIRKQIEEQTNPPPDVPVLTPDA